MTTYCDQLETLAFNQYNLALLSSKAFKYLIKNKKLKILINFFLWLIRLAQVWLDLGQLIQHFLIISCVASRIW